MRRLSAVVGILLLTASSAVAQSGTSTPSAGTSKTPRARAEVIDEMVTLAVNRARQTSPAPVKNPFESVVDAADVHFLAMYLLAVEHEANPTSNAGKLIDALLSRADKQLGSTVATSASTTIASKGLVPDILGVAVENGAINREVKDTTLTFRATPMGVVKAMQAQGLLDIYADYRTSSASHFASRFSVAASFDTSRGTAGTFTADGNQLSGWSVRAKIVDGRDPAKYAANWDLLLSGESSQAFRDATAKVVNVLGSWTAFTGWQKALAARVTKEVDTPFLTVKDLKAADAALRKVLGEELPKLANLPSRPTAVTQAVNEFTSALTKLQADIDAIYDFASKGQILTLDWATTRDVSLPDLFTVTGIYETSFGNDRKSDLTINAVANIYRRKPDGIDQAFKSFDLDAQIDRPLGRLLHANALLFTIAGRYSYIPKDTAAPTVGTAEANAGSPAAKGHIGVVQLKFTLPVTNGVKIPLSITASNRTELIKEEDVRASFGITFDLDTVLGIVGIK